MSFLLKVTLITILVKELEIKTQEHKCGYNYSDGWNKDHNSLFWQYIASSLALKCLAWFRCIAWLASETKSRLASNLGSDAAAPTELPWMSSLCAQALRCCWHSRSLLTTLEWGEARGIHFPRHSCPSLCPRSKRGQNAAVSMAVIVIHGS